MVERPARAAAVLVVTTQRTIGKHRSALIELVCSSAAYSVVFQGDASDIGRIQCLHVRRGRFACSSIGVMIG